MAGKRYSAGRIFLQVVPSFDNLQRDIRKGVKNISPDLAKQIEDDARKRGEKAARAEGEGRRKVAKAEFGKDAALIAREARRIGEMEGAEKAKALAKSRNALVHQRAQEAKQDHNEAVRQAKATADAVKAINDRALADRMRSEQRAHQERLRQQEQFRQEQEKAAKAEQDNLDRINERANAHRIREGQRNHAERQRMYEDLFDEIDKREQREADEAAKREQDKQDELARINERAMAWRIRQRQREVAEKRRQDEKDNADALARARRAHEEQKRLSGGRQGQIIRKASREALDALGGRDAVVGVNATEAERRIEVLRQELARLEDAHIGVDIDAGAAMAKIEAIKKELRSLSRKDGNVDIDVNAAAAMLALKRVEEQVDEINNKKVRGGLLGMFGGLTRSGDDGANSFRVFNWRVLALVSLLPALPPLLAAAAGGLGAIATAGTGAAAGLGVVILGFTGIQDAVSAMMDVEKNAAKDSLANEKAIRTAAKGTRDAEQGLAKARTQAARAQQDAARRVSDARRGVADAEREAAQAVESAQRTVENAERNLARTQRDATDAQNRLRLARKQAQQDQQDLADKIKSGQLDERQGLIDLFDATVAYNAAKADGGATNKEKEQLAINLERARLALKNTREENVALAEQQKQSDKEGVEGSQQVVDARQNVADQQERLADAQRNLSDAQAGLVRAQEDGARRIADANRSVADALRDQKESAADNAIAIRDAQERLTDAQAAYQEALTKTGEVGSASYQKLEQAMAVLGPEGQRFAKYLFSMRDGFYALRKEVQKGMLPGVMTAMQTIIDRYGPQFFAFMSKMGRVAGDFFVALGNAFVSPTMVAFFETMDQYAPEFFSLFGELGIDFVKIIAGMMTAFAPFAKDFMEGFVSMADSWAEWATNLRDNPEFQKFIAYVMAEGPIVLRLIGDILTTIINIGKGMSDNGTFDALVGFFDFVANLDPAIIATVVQAILGLFVASQVSSGIVSLYIAFQLLTTTLAGVVTLGLFALIAGFVLLYKKNEWFREKMDWIWARIKEYVGIFVDWFMAEAWPIIKQVFGEIKKAAYYLYYNVFKPVFQAIWVFVKIAFGLVALSWKYILLPVLKIIFQYVGWMWTHYWKPVLTNIGKLFGSTIRAISTIWTTLLQPVFVAIQQALQGDFAGAWDTVLAGIQNTWKQLPKILSGPVNAAIDILNGLTGGFNKIMKGLGSDIRIPVIAHVTWGQEKDPKMTAGGVRKSKGGGSNLKGGSWYTGGYTGPGGKYEPAGEVHRDEYVLRKEATNKLRRTFGLDFLDHMNAFGELPLLGGYASGGLVGFGKRLQEMGFNVSEHPAFGGVAPVHTKNSLHYSGNAVDVNYDGHGQGFETNKINSILALAREYGLRTIWQAPGHYDHAHFDTGRGGDIGKSSAPAWVTKPFEWLRGLVGGLTSRFPLGDSPIGKGLRSIPTKFLDAAESKIAEIFGGTGELGDKGRNGRNNPTAGVQRWRGLVNRALGMTGQPLSLADLVLGRMNQESSGDDRAINLWDSNAAKGTPSKGLMQVIDPTFAAYRDKGLSNDIFDPLANLVASMRYTLARYGSLSAGYGRSGGYWTGGLVGGFADNGMKLYDDGGMLQPGWTTVLNATGRPEPVFTADQMDRGMGPGGRGPLVGEYHTHLHGSDATAADAADEMMWVFNRIDHGGKFAGRAG